MVQAATYFVQERIKIAEAYFSRKSVVQTHRKFRKLSRQKRSHRTHNKAHLGQIQGQGNVQDNIKRRSGRPRSVSTENNIVIVRQCLEQSPRKFTWRLSLETDLSSSSATRIKHQDLNLFPYKMYRKICIQICFFSVTDRKDQIRIRARPMHRYTGMAKLPMYYIGKIPLIYIGNNCS